MISCLQATLSPGGVTTCVAQFPVSQADVEAGSVTVTAHAGAVDPRAAVVSAPSSAVSISGTPVSAVSLAGQALSSTFAAAGDTVAYRYVATNTGSTVLHGVAVADDHVASGHLSCAQTALNPGAATTCTGVYPVTQADVDAGTITITATATATGGGASVSSPTAPLTVTGSSPPAVTITASTVTSGYAVAGDTIEYRFLVADTGTTTLHSLAVAAQNLAPAAGHLSDRHAGARRVQTCTGSATVTQADIDAGTVTRAASVTGLNPAGATVTAGSHPVTLTTTAVAALSMTASSTTASYASAGDVIHYRYDVTNSGGTTLHGIAVGSSATCPQPTLAPGASQTCTGTAAVTQGDVDAGSVARTAAATALAPHGVLVSSADSSVTVTADPVASVALAVMPLTSRFAAAGDRLTFRYTLTDTGTTTLHGVSIADDHVAAGDLDCLQSVVAPGGSITCTGSYALTQDDVDTGSVAITAVASAIAPDGTTASSSVAAASVNAGPTSSISITAAADATALTAAGDVLTIDYHLANTGQTTLHAVAVSDDHVAAADISCPQSTLAVGEAITCTGTHVVTQAKTDMGAIISRSTAAAIDPHAASVTSGVAEARATVTPVSALTVVASSPTAGFSAAGNSVDYSYLVTNTGATTLHGVSVRDGSTSAAPADTRAGLLRDLHGLPSGGANRRRRRIGHHHRHRAGHRPSFGLGDIPASSVTVVATPISSISLA